ncbi:MAG: hypothetical protein IJY11_03885 [Clostridia bacterium]|nr:hypothetical protein [Clostridia bacterium]
MSNYSNLNVTDEELASYPASNGAVQKQQSSNWLYRILGLVLAVCPIVLTCLLPFGGKGTDTTLIDLLTPVFENFKEYFQILFSAAATFDLWISFISLLAMPIAMLCGVVFALIGLFSAKNAVKSTFRVIGANFWGIGGYLLTTLTFMYWNDLPISFEGGFFVLPLAICAGYAVIGFVLSILNSPKRVWMSTVTFVVSFLFNMVIVHVYKYYPPYVFGDAYKYGAYAVLIFSALCMFGTSAMLPRREKFADNLVAAILQLICTVGVLLLYVLNTDIIPSDFILSYNNPIILGLVACLVILGVFTVYALVFSIIRLIYFNKDVETVAPAKQKAPKAEAKAEPAKAETVAEPTATEAPAEEKDYIEAVPYEAPVVETVEEVEEEPAEEAAEEVTEEAAPSYVTYAPVAPAAAAPAGTTKLTDEFIATLSDEERQQFADIFFLKAKGDFPGVPDYVTGEDNTIFFRKIFVHLGKYRSRIPDDLLGKMYDYYTDK